MIIDWQKTCAKCKDGEIEPRHCEYYGEPNGCNSPIYGEHPKANPVGNAAAMREALEDVLEKIDRWRMDGVMEHWQYSQLFDIADSALSAPPRQCDVGTAEEQEERFRKFCKMDYISEDCPDDCPLYRKDYSTNHCPFAWEQMPYAQEGGEK